MHDANSIWLIVIILWFVLILKEQCFFLVLQLAVSLLKCLHRNAWRKLKSFLHFCISIISDTASPSAELTPLQLSKVFRHAYVTHVSRPRTPTFATPHVVLSLNVCAHICDWPLSIYLIFGNNNHLHRRTIFITLQIFCESFMCFEIRWSEQLSVRN